MSGRPAGPFSTSVAPVHPTIAAWGSTSGKRPCWGTESQGLRSTGTSEYHRIWKWGFCRCNHVEMSSYWIRVAPHSLPGVLWEEGDLDIGRESGHTERPCEDGGREGGMQLQTEAAKDCWQPPAAQVGRTLPQSRQREYGPADTLIFPSPPRGEDTRF